MILQTKNILWSKSTISDLIAEFRKCTDLLNREKHILHNQDIFIKRVRVLENLGILGPKAKAAAVHLVNALKTDPLHDYEIISALGYIGISDAEPAMTKLKNLQEVVLKHLPVSEMSEKLFLLNSEITGLIEKLKKLRPQV